MPCYYPLSAQRGADGSVKVGGQRGSNRFSDIGSRWLYLPCGSCVGCIKSRARDWAIRCSLELQYHDVACWATLTYDDDHCPPTLQKWHLQLFMRRLRKLSDAPVRFFASGEYGEKYGRPHYHPILYGVADESLIQDAWRDGRGTPLGFAKMHPLNFAGIAYVAGYVQKKFHFRESKEVRIDWSTGEEYVYQPPFIQMSRKPGIGGNAAGEFAARWRNGALYKDRTVRVPRYLHEAWKKSSSWRGVMEKALEVAKYERENPVDWERLEAGEVIARAGVALSSSKRGVE